MAFVHAGGTVIKRELKGETLRVDTGCLVAFTDGISYDIQRAGNLKSMFFGGEGLFLATLSGHGTVWLQSLPFSRLADRILAHAPSAGGNAKGKGRCSAEWGGCWTGIETGGSVERHLDIEGDTQIAAEGKRVVTTLIKQGRRIAEAVAEAEAGLVLDVQTDTGFEAVVV